MRLSRHRRARPRRDRHLGHSSRHERQLGAVGDCFRITDAVAKADGLAAPGWGIYLTVIGALILTVSAFLARRSTVTPRKPMLADDLA